MAYDPVLSPLLSQEALGLAPDELEAESRIAERVLGLAGSELTGAAAVEAADLVALQVNLQVARRGAMDVVSESKGGQSLTYAQVGGRRVVVDPVAYAGALALLALIAPLAPQSSAEPTTIVW